MVTPNLLSDLAPEETWALTMGEKTSYRYRRNLKHTRTPEKYSVMYAISLETSIPPL